MKGGFEIKTVKNSEFTYTRDRGRINWVKNAYPIGLNLVSCVQNIPWLDYSYSGTIPLWYSEDEETYKIEEVPISTYFKYKPYYFFGGCVYELMNAIDSRATVNLRDYVDPTGDIDVRLVMPFIRIPDKHPVDHYEYLLTEDGAHMNILLDNYTRWIYDQLKIQLERMPLFAKLFENTVPFDYREVHEADTSDIQDRVGNLWIVRSPQYDRGMIKIQIVAKFETTEPDHILELVLPIKSKPGIDILNTAANNFQEKYNSINGFPLESFSQLIQGNLSGMTDRQSLHINATLRHKFYNHVGRIQYLNNYFHTYPDRMIDNPAKFETQLLQLFHYLIQQRNAGKLCEFVYNGEACIPNTIMRSIVEYLVPFVKNVRGNQYIAAIKKPVRISDILSQLYLAEGGRRTRRKTRKVVKRKGG